MVDQKAFIPVRLYTVLGISCDSLRNEHPPELTIPPPLKGFEQLFSEGEESLEMLYALYIVKARFASRFSSTRVSSSGDRKLLVI